MSEWLLTQAGSSVFTRSAHQSEAAPHAHVSGGAGLQEEGGAHQRSEYCKQLLMRGGEELSFEELRAERFNQRRQQQLDERLRSMTELKEQLSLELEEKNKLLLQLRSQQQQQQEVPEGSSFRIMDSGRSGPAASSFQIYDESQSTAAAARPAGNVLPDDVFLRPDETGLSLKIQCPRPGAAAPSGLCQAEDLIQSGLQNKTLSENTSHTSDQQRGATTDPQTAEEARPPTASQKPASKMRKKLSPIQETSVDASSLTSLGGCSPLEEDQEEVDRTPSPAGGAVDPCDQDVRRRLLDLCDVTSSPDFHSDPRPLPVVEEGSCVQLGGDMYRIYSRVLDGGSYSVYEGASDEDNVLIKVDSCSVPWDFHQFQRLKKNSACRPPLISCFLFVDGCVTVYTTHTGHMFTELTECVTSEASVGHKAIALLQLVSELHSCRLLHAALQPRLLTCHRGLLSPDWLFPVDWSSSVDLDLQQDVTSVQQVPSAQSYIRLGLLEPTDPPQLVDLVGVAETVHFLLTNSSMVPVKDDGGWTAEQFREEPCDTFSRMWQRFFRLLLNVGGRSSSSILSELKEHLSDLYC